MVRKKLRGCAWRGLCCDFPSLSTESIAVSRDDIGDNMLIPVSGVVG